MARKNSDRSRKAEKSGSEVFADADSSIAAAALSPAAQRSEAIRTGAQRETVEAFVVAFILALLFRAFIAEAFVIPTGSMAPTLMGAHKEIDCDSCSQRFRIGASLEQRGPVTEQVVVGGVCPNCRYLNALDLKEESNDATFSGDRILVSKFAYTIRDPSRWDVIVFKFPGNPKQNYIKRLVGLPGETITIRHGDVHARPTGSSDKDQVLRKSAEKILAMRHLVYDSNHQSAGLIDAKYPARLQPWNPGATSPPKDAWTIQQNDSGLTATLGGEASESGEAKWLRYYHRWPSVDQWAQAADGQLLDSVDPYGSTAITDFYQYNSYAIVDADAVYDQKPSTVGGSMLSRLLGGSYSGGVFRPSYRSGEDLSQFRFINFGTYDTGFDGLHWVGDLLAEADIEVDASAKMLTLELIEAGAKHLCQIDLTSGVATLSIDVDGRSVSFGGESNPAAATEVLSGTRHRVRFSNCDDQLMLWVDDNPIEFDQPTTFNGADVRGVEQQTPRFDGAGNPLDASPIGLAVTGGGATLHRMRIDRDKYYIATADSAEVYDYDLQKISGATRGRQDEWGQRFQQQFGDPSAWATSPIWNGRRSVSFELQEDQFFPMGDNSPESLDARCWTGGRRFGVITSVDENAYRFSDANYVPRDLLVGKALAVFWPHPWNSPVPFTPNLKRMKLIR